MSHEQDLAKVFATEGRVLTPADLAERLPYAAGLMAERAELLRQLAAVDLVLAWGEPGPGCPSLRLPADLPEAAHRKAEDLGAARITKVQVAASFRAGAKPGAAAAFVFHFRNTVRRLQEIRNETRSETL